MTVTEDRPAALEIGNKRRRKEDQRLITGRTKWTDNIQLTGMLHIAMVRSPFAHAKITHIDTAEAKAAPNVVAVLTGEDVKDEQGSLPNAWAITPDQVTPNHPSIAVDRVAFAGEVVAVVVARTAAEARDAAELVDVDYEELPAALDLRESAEDKVLAHPDLGTNKSAFWQFDSEGAGTGGSVDAAIEKARADGIVIEREYRQQRLIPAFMEPRSVVVDPTGEQLTMWSATQNPHILRFLLAAILGMSESKIRVIAPDVGGGFGGKLQVTPEEFITFMAARRLGKPVKYTETRSESLMAAHHGRDQWQKLTLAATKDGKVTGLKVDLIADLGAYVALVGGGVPVLGAFMFNSIYKFAAYQFNCTTVLTNKTWTDAYRGAGRPEATFAHRADHGRARPRARRGPARGPREELDQEHRVPVHDRLRHGVRLRQLRGGHRAGQGDLRVRRAAGRAEAAARVERPDPARHRRLDVHRDVRPGALAGARQPELRRRRLGERLGPDAPDRQGRGRHGLLRARPGPRDRLVPDHRGPARRPVRGRRGAARRHAGRGQGHGHLRLALAGRRWRGAGPGRRQGDREGQADRGAPARGLRRRHRVQGRPVRRQGHRQGPGDGGDRAGDVRGAQPARRHRAHARLRRDLRPGRTSPSRTARTCARWRSTPRPVG